MSDKQLKVTFCDKKTEDDFESLKEGKFEDKELYKFIDRSINDLKKNPTCGTRIEKRLWPKEYKQKYGITNLWKYDLPNAWRVVYTIQSNEVMIISVILEWFNHKDYERRFHY